MSLWYVSTWDWTLVSWTIGKHSNNYANGQQPYLFSFSLSGTVWKACLLLWRWVFFLYLNGKFHTKLVWNYYFSPETNPFIKENHHHHHHHQVVLLARIFLTLSRHFSLSFIASCRSSGPHPISSHSSWMYVRAGRPAFARPYMGIHRSTSLMSLSLLL